MTYHHAHKLMNFSTPIREDYSTVDCNQHSNQGAENTRLWRQSSLKQNIYIRSPTPKPWGYDGKEGTMTVKAIGGRQLKGKNTASIQQGSTQEFREVQYAQVLSRVRKDKILACRQEVGSRSHPQPRSYWWVIVVRKKRIHVKAWVGRLLSSDGHTSKSMASINCTL